MENISGITFNKERINHIKYLRSLNLVLPYSFLLNIVESLISGLKTVTAINEKLYPCGRYPVIQSWLEEQGSVPIKSPAEDIVTISIYY